MRSHVPAGAQPGSVAIGDFNSDGKLDLAVTQSIANVNVLLGNGDIGATATTAALNPGTMSFFCVARLVGGGCTPPPEGNSDEHGSFDTLRVRDQH